MIDLSLAISSLKAAQAAAEKYSDLPLKHALVTAYDGILHTKEQALLLQEELHGARRRIMDLERQLEENAADPAEGLTYDRQAYWASPSREHGADGPFCSNCIDSRAGRPRLTPAGSRASCPQCKQSFAVWPERYVRPRPQRGGGFNSIW